MPDKLTHFSRGRALQRVRTVVRFSMWVQKTVRLSPRKRGCHLVTDEVYQACKEELRAFKVGLVHILLQHTSASLTLNEVSFLYSQVTCNRTVIQTCVSI
jgi:hypothetical protein